jgi:hypothetical protein
MSQPAEVSAQLKEYVVTRIAELKKLDRNRYDELKADFQHLYWADLTPEEAVTTRERWEWLLGQLGEWRVERLREKVRKEAANSKQPQANKTHKPIEVYRGASIHDQFPRCKPCRWVVIHQHQKRWFDSLAEAMVCIYQHT